MDGKIFWENGTFAVRYSARKGLTLHYVRNKEVEVLAPYGTRERDILAFMDRHRVWIHNRLKSIEAAGETVPNDLEKYVWVGGVRYEIKRDPTRAGRIDGVFYAPDAAAVRAWLQQEARRIFPSTLERWAKEMRVTVKGLRISATKSKWGSNRGSARNDSHVQLNLWLVCVPERLLEYVVIHELAHDYHRNHSKSFWNVVARYCPDWEARRKELRKNYGFLLRA